MKNEVKNSLFNVVLISVCAFIGVGFITGAEIWFYFARFGSSMIFGLIIFAILCFFLIYYALGDSDSHSYKSKFKDYALGISELLVASAMVSGLIETTKELFAGWWFIVFLLAISVMIYVFWRGFKSVIIYNYFVAIFIIFVLATLLLFNNKINKIYTLNFSSELSFKNITNSCIFSVIYIFMNISEIRPILLRYETKNMKKRKIILSLIISSVLIFLVITFGLILIQNKNITNLSMPFLLLFNNYGNLYKFVFLIGLILTLVSTSVACMTGVKEKLNFSKNDVNFSKMIVILSSLIFGQLPFSFFVKKIYPIIGVTNFVIFIAEIILSRKRSKFFK